MIAVTGANGLLGSFIVRKLLKERRPFVALTRKGSDRSLLDDVRDQIKFIDGDILDPIQLADAFQGASVVIHAAAMVSFNPRMKRALYDTNVVGTRNVINAALEAGAKRIVHISSVAALGRTKGQTVIDETNKWSNSAINSTYGETKYLAELEVYRGQEEGLEAVILNPSVILAAADWTKSSAKLFKYVYDEKPFYIDNHLNYVDARDVAHAALLLMDNAPSGERFIVSAGAISLHDFFKKVASRLNKKPPHIKINGAFLKTLVATEVWRSRILGQEPLVTPETARLAGTRFLYQNEKLKNHLNFAFQTIDHTLDWCCQHYLNPDRTKN